MKMKRNILFIAMLAMFSTPVKPMDDSLKVVGGIIVGSAVLIGGVTFVNWLYSDPVYYCPSCDGVIDPQDTFYAGCGHQFHKRHYDSQIICRYCEQNKRGYRTFGEILWCAFVVADAIARTTPQEHATPTEHPAQKQQETKNDTKVAMQNAARDARPFFGNNPSSAQVIEQQQQILSECNAKKEAQSGFATRVQAENNQTDLHGAAYAQKKAHEQRDAQARANRASQVEADNRQRQEASRQRGQKYPRRIFESQDEMMDICVANCLEPLAKKGDDLVDLNNPYHADHVTTLPCGNGKHSFHTECIKGWAEGHNTCPICRARFDASKL